MGCQPSRPSSAAVRSLRNSSNKFGSIEDSVHVMLEHDKKSCARRGQAMAGYIPRRPHPLLLDHPAPVLLPKPAAAAAAVVAFEDENDDGEENDALAKPSNDEEGHTVDLSQGDESEAGEHRRHWRHRGSSAADETTEQARRRLLWHTAHHCATVDPRDVRLVGPRAHRIPTTAFVGGG